MLMAHAPPSPRTGLRHCEQRRYLVQQASTQHALNLQVGNMRFGGLPKAQHPLGAFPVVTAADGLAQEQRFGRLLGNTIELMHHLHDSDPTELSDATQPHNLLPRPKYVQEQELRVKLGASAMLSQQARLHPSLPQQKNCRHTFPAGKCLLTSLFSGLFHTTSYPAKLLSAPMYVVLKCAAR